MKKINVLAIPDMHYPFQHRDALDFLKAVQRKYKTNTTVCLGDILDNHALAQWDSDPDGDAPGPEILKARKMLKPLMKAFPKLMICYGNHDNRAQRKAFKHGISKIFLRNLNDVLEAPSGWKWADKWTVGGVRYEHGDCMGPNSQGASAAKQIPEKNMQSTVFGHFHVNASIAIMANPRMLYWGMNAGCLLDPKAYAFHYAKKWKSKPILGCGVVLNGQPIFVPMILNARGRWIRKL